MSQNNDNHIDESEELFNTEDLQLESAELITPQEKVQDVEMSENFDVEEAEIEENDDEVLADMIDDSEALDEETEDIEGLEAVNNKTDEPTGKGRKS